MKFLLAFVLFQVVFSKQADRRDTDLFEQHLRKKFQPEIIPLEKSDKQPLKVTLGLNLESILLVDEDKAELIVTERYMWQDKHLAWDKNSPKTKIESVSVNISHLWMPDLAIRTIMNETEVLTPEKAILYFNGTVIYEPRKHMRVFAYPLESKKFNVSIEYKSATYEVYDLVFEQPTKDSLNLRYLRLSKWDVEKTDVKKQARNFPPSSGTYDVLTFNITLKAHE